MTKTYFAIALAALTLFLSAPAYAKHPKEQPQLTISSNQPLTPEDREHLLNDTFTVVKTVREISQPVQDLLFQRVTSPLGMADPGKEWQESDMLSPKPLSFRRLILAANSAQYSLVYDEHGGVGYYELISFYRLTGGSAELVWSGGVENSPGFLSFDQIYALIRDWKYSPPKRR